MEGNHAPGGLDEAVPEMEQEMSRQMIFPRCKPHFDSIRKMRSDDFQTRYRSLRNVSSHFIERPDVRRSIFNKCGSKCYLCGSQEHLQIDHVISVWQGAKEKIPYYIINSYENLMVICRKCNSGKAVIQVKCQEDQSRG